ncbi:MAG: hypothetical protein QCI38_05655 [Candidatus Thermoplasmatota archaeon]|nr:hypothetical protein [Candidatus Thermoplasmatota archaeon]
MKKTRATKLFAVGLALFMALPAFSMLAQAQEEVSDVYTITTEQGSIDTPGFIGGGDYFYIKFGTDENGLDTLFGLQWGTENNLNTISVVTLQARHLGMANIEGEQGGVVQRPLKVYTFHGIRLGNLFEFDDINGNGLADFKYANIGDEQSGITVEGDVFFNKMVPMFGAWETDGPVEHGTDENGEMHWSITLTAENRSYRKVRPLMPWSQGDENITNEVLDRITFTFHFYARLEEVSGITVPQWRIQVNRRAGPGDNWEINSVDNIAPITNATAKQAMYRVKWDQEIIGWDFNANNVNKTLILETTSILGNHMPQNMARWMVQNQENIMHRLGESGEYRYQYPGGAEVDNGTEPQPPAPRLVQQNRIEYGGNWSRIARFTWVSNVTVDGLEKEMHLQVHGGARIAPMAVRNRNFQGFVVRAGMVFPGGEEIFHDPAVDGQVYLSISTSTTDTPTPIGGRLLLFGVVAAVAVLVAVLIIHKKMNKPSGYHEQYEKPKQPEDQWEEYYKK